MTAAVRRLHVSGHEPKGDGGLAYGLRQPVRPSGARTLRAVNPPGMLAGERQRRTLPLAGWPTAGRPGMGRAGARPAAVVTHSCTAPGIYG